MPVGLPALSLHCLGRRHVVEEQRGRADQRERVAARGRDARSCASSAVSFESAVFTTTWRQARPPLALMYVGPRLHRVDRALEQAGPERRTGVGDHA